MIDTAQAKNKIYNHNSVNPYVDITPYELQVGFPIVKYVGFFPSAGEVIIYAVPSATFTDKEQVVGYTGKSAGASVRVAKGLTVRTGSLGGRPVRDTVRKRSVGDLIITNKRVVFVGKDDNFDFPINKISAVKPLSKDTFVIQSGRSSKNLYVNAGATIYAAGFIKYSVTAFNDNLDIIEEKKQAEKDITAEQKALCDTVSSEVITMTAINRKTEKKPKGCLTRILLGVLLFFVAILVGVVIYAITLSNPNNGVDSNGNIVSVQSYTDTEILYKEGHPVINDTFKECKDFYADVSKNKVKVLSIADHAAIERKLETLTSDTVVLYLIQGSTQKDYVGTVQINLFSPKLTNDMSIEKAVDLLTNYLPKGFGDYYNQDSCYVYSQKSVDVYTYSCRLNEAGRTYNENNEETANLSPYYFLRFVHYTDTNQWKLETGYSAFGDKDKGWIEKYAQSWDIDMNSYLSN